jgi:hypothetical protein
MTENGQFLYAVALTRLEMLTEGRTPEGDEILARHFDYLEGLATRCVVLLAG